jgi:hypothetical protein
MNRWISIGIALSFVWAVGAGLYTHNSDVERADSFAKFAYEVCAKGKTLDHNDDLSDCDRERAKNWAIWTKGDVGNVVFAALVPLPFGWLGTFILLYIVRAQIAGFRAVVPWAKLNWLKRAFVVFCVFDSLAVALFGLMIVLNLYVDTLVPVSLYPFGPEVFETGENFVTVKGTWTRVGSLGGEGTALAFPLQTSRIDCEKLERRCIEARASVSGNVLVSDIEEYEVDSWTADSIVFRNDGPCATEVYTVDLHTHAVSGAGHVTNEQSSSCAFGDRSEKSWKYQLTDGFKVYWDQRMKARPWLLRLIQVLFGGG